MIVYKTPHLLFKRALVWHFPYDKNADPEKPVYTPLLSG
jgi:hypothetical protein